MVINVTNHGAEHVLDCDQCHKSSEGEILPRGSPRSAQREFASPQSQLYILICRQSLQDLNETRVTKLNAIWTLSSSLEIECHQRCTEHLNFAISEIKRNIPTLDSNMFIEHNRANWVEPVEFRFEPSMVWNDTDDMVIDEPAQVFLRNIMTKSRRALEEVKPDLEKKRREVDALRSRKEDVKYDESKAVNDGEITRVGDLRR